MKNDNVINKRLILIILPFVHVINFGYDMPGAIDLDERVEVRIVGADRILFHVDTHHSGCRCNSEYVDSCLDIRRSPVFLDKVVEVFDRTAEQLAISKTVHHGVVVKCVGDTSDTANAQTLDIFGNRRNYVFIVIGRYSLDII